MNDFGSPTENRSPSRSVFLRVLLGAGLALAVSGINAYVGHISVLSHLPTGTLTASLVGGKGKGTRFEWRLQRGKHWQIVSSPSESQETTDSIEGTRGICGSGMVEVKGHMKLDPSSNSFYDRNSIEELQKTTCTRWIQREYPERCAVFDRDKWLAISSEFPTRLMHFCMDRFEYPNAKGAYPWIGVSWYEATELCESEGKRLCSENEWTFACEGEEAMPYPYGYTRDATACVVDKMWRPFNEAAMQPRGAPAAMAEMDRLWQGVASGTQPRCRSPFGVYDMVGNIDEWTHTSREGERPSILKGGYWGPVRTRCRPTTRSHDENHVFYQQGFRCCTDPNVVPVRRTVSEDPARAPLPPEIR